MDPVLVVSAHYDDAVLSAGQFMAGRPDCIVVTVFGGKPVFPVVTEYDLKCGFTDSDDAVAGRRAENADAVALLKAHAVDLGFVDGQYGEPVDIDEVAWRIAQVVDAVQPEFVAAPLGLVHPDHVLVREAVLKLRFPQPLWLYEDLPYRVENPETVPDAFDAVQKHGCTLELGSVGTGPAATKLSALWSYRSQMRLPDFDNVHNFLVPERFWLTCRP